MPTISTTINVGKSRLLPFVVRNDVGAVDTTTDVVVGCNSASQVRAVISSTDKRVVVLSGLASTAFPPLVTITSPFGDSVSFEVNVPVPPDTSAIELGEFGEEFDTPV